MSLASYVHIKALCSQKRLKDALERIFSAYRQGVQLDSDSVAEILLLCASVGAIAEGRELHALLRAKAVGPNRYLLNNLLNMYLKCGSLDEGQQVFEEMSIRDVVAWNAMIAGYAKSDHASEAVKLFWRMQQDNVQPNKNTFVCALMACTPPVCVEDGSCIHCFLVTCALESNVCVGSALVGMYFKFKRLSDAHRVFEDMTVRDVVIWTSMITGYSDHGYVDEALCLFQRMLQEGVVPDKVIFLSALGACTSPNTLRSGILLHLLIINADMGLSPSIGSTLVNMYAKCGNLHLAHKLFEQLSFKDTVSWTALMTGYEQLGESDKALGVFNDMLTTGVDPGVVTFVSAIRSCMILTALDLGIIVHSGVVESGFESNLYVASALLSMYAKCGSEEDMHLVFVKLSKRDAIIWNAMIDGLAQHGNSERALQYFEQMKEDGVEVDSMTFVGVLSACNHAGLVDEGLCYFDLMLQGDRVELTVEVYACMVDILSRAGRLEAANALVWKLSRESSMYLWTPLLSACRVHGNVDVAVSAGESMIKLQPQRESTYVLLSNVYALTECKEKALVSGDCLP